MDTGAVTGAYEAFRDDLKQELEKQVEGFVRIGYKLKLARDTGILEGSGYRDYKEFAWAEYRLDSSITSRYISINDRYSVGGNSEILKTEYQGYGYTKLAEMLSIPDEIAENLDPSLSKMDIRQIAGEIREEKKITDLEVLMEGQQEQQQELTLVQKVMRQYFHDHREDFVKLADVLGRGTYSEKDPERVMDVLAPAGTAVVFVRVTGIGKIMVSFRGTEQEVTIQNTRTMETVKEGWEKFCCGMKLIFWGENFSDPGKAWEAVYQEAFKTEKRTENSVQEGSKKKTSVSKVIGTPKKEKIAPTQKEAQLEPENASDPEVGAPEPPAVEPDQTGEIQEQKEEAPDSEEEEQAEPDPEGSAAEEMKPEQREEDPAQMPETQEGQIPGQDTILNHPEYLPTDYPTDAQVDGEPVSAAVEPTPAQRKEECLSLISTIQGNVTLEKYGEAYRAAGRLLECLEVMK